MVGSPVFDVVLHQLQDLTLHSVLLGLGKIAMTRLAGHLLGAAAQRLIAWIMPPIRRWRRRIESAVLSTLREMPPMQTWTALPAKKTAKKPRR